MIKDLLFVIDNAKRTEPFLKAAVALGESFGAYCEVVTLSAGPLLAAEFAPLGALYLPEDELRRDEEARLAEVRKLVAEATCPVEVYGLRDDVAWIPQDLRLSRPLADLCVVGTEECWEVPWLRRRVLDTLLLSTGTPLLLLPPNKPLGRIRHAIVGWKASPEANRAVHDLVAIAEPGARVELVTVGANPGDANALATVAEAQRHLVRHGFDVSTFALPEGDWSRVAEVLEHHARRRQADLLVVGAYMHSRLRETAFGGVTRDLLSNAIIPVLLSH
ncbi:universal stress protein [Sphingomonas cannabina]|uniref:universal stress protein n=1 Tax=Sphingomonas cannabina TaxID=2899123 RepID=UPI001F2317C5|nr:universal stress protein [Sphingomonas cannabina]UIJ46332.1 universal stress protein [Sphingomonas cannabina]